MQQLNIGCHNNLMKNIICSEKIGTTQNLSNCLKDEGPTITACTVETAFYDHPLVQQKQS